MNPVMRIYADQECKDGRRVKDIEKNVMFLLGIKEEDDYRLGNGNFLVYDRSYWAVSYLMKAGLLEKTERGLYKITNEGVKALKSGAEINTEFLLKNYKLFRNFKEKVKKDASENKTVNANETILESDDPYAKLNNAIVEYNRELMNDMLDKLCEMTPVNFERFVCKFMELLGYGAGEVTQPTRDGGIDGVVKEDKLGLHKIYLQAKRYARDNSVTPKDVQAFIGAMSSTATGGVFITTGTFSKDARENVKSPNSGKTVILIDGKDLVRLMKENNIGFCSKRNSDEVKEISKEFLAEYGIDE
jgi:restriction system protein